MSAPRRALVVIDAQLEYFDGLLRIRHPHPDRSLDATIEALAAATRAGIPVVVVQHDGGSGAPVFDPDGPRFALHPRLEAVRDASWITVRKSASSIYAGTGLADRLRGLGVDTVALAGFMTNNCVLASAAEAEVLDLATEVLSDATGAIAIANAAGVASAETVHSTVMALLASNWAAVAPTADWIAALEAREPLAASDLVSSAAAGAEAEGRESR